MTDSRTTERAAGRLHRLVLAAALMLTVFGLPTLVAAHPLGNFTVNRLSRLTLNQRSVELRYVIDMAEVSAFQERNNQIDEDWDGVLSTDEKARYIARKAAQIAENARLTIDGLPVTWTLTGSDLSFPPGQAELPTLRLVLDFTAPLPAGGSKRAGAYADGNFEDRLGWREVVVLNGAGATLATSSVPDTDATNELRDYPEALLQTPLAMTSAEFVFALRAASGTGGAIPASPAPTTNASRPSVDPAADQMSAFLRGQLTPATLALALAIAFALGAVHALSPGHGKTVVAAYLIGSRGTPLHALYLGLTVTVTHTAGVFALGLVTLFLAQYILPERLYPWLSLLSGLLVVAIGLVLFRSRLAGALRWRQGRSAPAQARVAGGPGAMFHETKPAIHDPAAMVLNGGRRPQPASVSTAATATARAVGHDDHAHLPDGRVLRQHDAAQGAAPHAPVRLHDHVGHNHDHHHAHHHGPGGHSHLPPGTAGERVTWRNLLALGISGGLLPCPSALVVLLSAIALHQVGLGLLLIVAFSAGLAAILTGIGLLLVWARVLFARLPLDGALSRVLPAVSALVITLAGVALSAEAIWQMR